MRCSPATEFVNASTSCEECCNANGVCIDGGCQCLGGFEEADNCGKYIITVYLARFYIYSYPLTCNLLCITTKGEQTRSRQSYLMLSEVCRHGIAIYQFTYYIIMARSLRMHGI